MKNGEKFITVGPGVTVVQGDKVVELPIGSVFAYMEEDRYQKYGLQQAEETAY